MTAVEMVDDNCHTEQKMTFYAFCTCLIIGICQSKNREILWVTLQVLEKQSFIA